MCGCPLLGGSKEIFLCGPVPILDFECQRSQRITGSLFCNLSSRMASDSLQLQFYSHSHSVIELLHYASRKKWFFHCHPYIIQMVPKSAAPSRNTRLARLMWLPLAGGDWTTEVSSLPGWALMQIPLSTLEKLGPSSYQWCIGGPN